MKLEFSREIFGKGLNIKFYQNPSSRSRVVPCGLTRRTDGQTDISKLTVVFCNFANTPSFSSFSPDLFLEYIQNIFIFRIYPKQALHFLRILKVFLQCLYQYCMTRVSTVTFCLTSYKAKPFHFFAFLNKLLKQFFLPSCYQFTKCATELYVLNANWKNILNKKKVCLCLPDPCKVRKLAIL